MLTVENLASRYGRIEVLHGVSLNVEAGEIVTLVGSNGAGKTTLLRAISGVQPISAGTIRFAGHTIDGLHAHHRVARGIAQVPEGRQVFAPLSVEDNLQLGAFTRTDKEIRVDLDQVYSTFPALAERRTTVAGALSGGQQQMLVIGRALMARPKLVLLDEPSIGTLAHTGRADLFDHQRTESEWADDSAGRAECQCGARDCRPRLCDRNGPYRDERFGKRVVE